MSAYAALVSLKSLIERVQLHNACQPIFLEEQHKLLRSLLKKVSFLQEFLGTYSHVDSKQVDDFENQIVDVAYAAEVFIELYIVDIVHAKHTSDEETSSINQSSSTRIKRLDLVRPTSFTKRISDLLPEGMIRLIRENEEVRSVIRDTGFESIVDLIHPQRTSHGETTSINHSRLLKELNLFRSMHSTEWSSDVLFEGLQKVIRDANSIKKEAMEIKENGGLKVQRSRDLDSLRPPLSGEDVVVGLDESLIIIMDKLTGDQPNLQTISITGMAGIGKTKLAKYVYNNPYIVQYFDICGWVTISQDFTVRQMLLDLLRAVGILTSQREEESLEYSLGEKLYKHLSGRRYLVVMDDIWDIEAWDKLKLFLPDNKNKSRVIVTTRLLPVAKSFGCTNLHKMNLLDENKSWDLFCSKVFDQESCPTELEKTGKKIVKSCQGLPFSILVIGGLLAKSNLGREYWEYVAKNINAIVNSEDDQGCSKILSLSYNHLPIQLKPCLLYMGVFQEDREIRVSTLIKVWVAEGFLNPSGEKCLEDVAEDCLKDLIDRNILLDARSGAIGKTKFCKIHDLWRDFAQMEAKKKRFICVTAPCFSHRVNSQCRVVRRDDMPYRNTRHEISLRSFRSIRPSIYKFILDEAPSLDFRFLRALTHYSQHSRGDVLRVVNARFIHLEAHRTFFSSICLAWNLQTIIIEGEELAMVAPSEIWEMRQLRHVKIEGLSLPDPHYQGASRKDEFVLENFQTLAFILNFKCTEEVVKRIPNIKKLRMWYSNKSDTGLSLYSLNNLSRLQKLQSLVCGHPDKKYPPPETDFLRYLSFSLSLMKLSLCHCYFSNEDMITKIGWLPNLEKLKLVRCVIKDEWNTVEGQFLRLKFLEMEYTDLRKWTLESSHFPRLEHIGLELMEQLEEIPSGIGDIGTLRTIRLSYCRDSIVTSAKDIIEEQRSLGNEDLCLVLK